MEGGQVGSLLVDLASNGIVDFREAKVLDRKWTLRLKWLAKSHASNKYAEMVKLSVLRYTGALGYGEADMFNKASEGLNALLDEYGKVVRPWLKVEEAT